MYVVLWALASLSIVVVNEQLADYLETTEPDLWIYRVSYLRRQITLNATLR